MTMKRAITVTVNGQQHHTEVEPRMLLVHYLRDVLDLTGTHIGCNTSQCGACIVLVNGEAVKSCTVFAVQADGCEVTTIEGLAQGDRLDPVQQAFLDHSAFQCGYCTPGMIIATKALLASNPHPTEDEIRDFLSGNLCRCGTYSEVIAAIKSLSSGVVST